MKKLISSLILLCGIAIVVGFSAVTANAQAIDGNKMYKSEPAENMFKSKIASNNPRLETSIKETFSPNGSKKITDGDASGDLTVTID